jgi:hypothetical protein
MRSQPAFGGVALAILLFGPIGLDDKLRHQRQDHRMARGDNGGRQHRMIALDITIGALAGLAMRAAELLRAEILSAIKRNQDPPVQALEGLHPILTRHQRFQRVIERRLQVRGMNRVEHCANVIVGRDIVHPEQSVAVGRLTPLLQRPLKRQKRLRLHEKQRKGRQPNIRHRIDAFALPFVRKGSANQLEMGEELFKNLHLNLESEPSPRRKPNF